MPGSLKPFMDVSGIAAMNRRQGTPETVLVGRCEDQMHMIGHQHPSPYPNIGCFAVCRQQIAIKSVISVAKKRLRTTVPTLRHVMWYPRDDKASETSHA